eukprot:Lankesteria_metandrocarpae@DN175_c0_g1_i1.p1
MAKTATADTTAGERFYESRFPEPDDLVMVKVTRIADMGAYCELLEYSGMEGMILMSELSKRRFRSINKLIKVGRKEVVMVLRVDKEKGYIDLSKRRVSHEDIATCEDKYSKSKKVHQTIRHIAQSQNVPMAVLNEKIVWPLYREYGHALDALKAAAVSGNKVFETADIPENVKDSLIKDIQTRLSPTPLKLQARIHVACFGYDGIDAVKAALLTAQSPDSKATNLKVKLIAAPQYVVVTTCFDKDQGLLHINEALTNIEESITAVKGGEYKLVGEILVVGGDDDSRLQELAEENSDSDDDNSDDDSEEDVGMGLVDEADMAATQDHNNSDDADEDGNATGSTHDTGVSFSTTSNADGVAGTQ